MKRLIINADDFGLSRGINRGIMDLFHQGRLTSVSLMVNMPGFDDAVAFIKQNPSLGVGVHLNVLRGRPIAPVDQVESLCRGDFFKGSLAHLWFLPLVCPRGLDEFGVECRAQIEKALSQGISITHLDSEKHVHLIKPFFKVLVKIAKEYGISKIRCINEWPYLGRPDFFSKQFYAALYWSFCSKGHKRLLEEHGLKAPDYFFGISSTGQPSLEHYAQVLAGLKKGSTEIMCHPGYIDEQWQEHPLNREKFRINKDRPKELELLLNPQIKTLLKQEDIALVNYGGL